MTSLSRSLFAAYVAAEPQRMAAWNYDARYHAELTRREHVLDRVDAGLVSAGWTEDERAEALALLFAPPPDARATVVAMHARSVRITRLCEAAPPPVLVTVEDAAVWTGVLGQSG